MADDNQEQRRPLTASFAPFASFCRTTGDPAALGSELRSIVKTATPNGVIEQVTTMETRLMMSMAKPRGPD